MLLQMLMQRGQNGSREPDSANRLEAARSSYAESAAASNRYDPMRLTSCFNQGVNEMDTPELAGRGGGDVEEESDSPDKSDGSDGDEFDDG